MRNSNVAHRTCLALTCLAVVAPAAAQDDPAKREAATGRGTKPTASAPAAGASKPGPLPQVQLEIVQGDQAWGDVVLELNENKAPVTVKNFLGYVDKGFYDGTIFHRVISDFMIQGGGFTSLTRRKTEGLDKPIQNEAKNGLKNRRGTIAMARTGHPHSATAQFFINVKDNAFLDYPGQDGWGYCVFGKVVKGMDVVDRIKEVETRPSPRNPGKKSSQPVNPPKIKKARRAAARHRVLILCTGNSARSQMAEGLWRHHGGSQWEVFSAGITPAAAVKPLAVKALAEIGIDISKQKTKSVDAFVQQPFDLVVTVCANAEKKCPVFPNARRREHWPVDDPSQATGSEDDRMKVYRLARDQIRIAVQREIEKATK